MKKLICLAGFVALLFCNTGTMSDQGRTDRIGTLFPREFTGQYQWREPGPIQLVSIKFTAVRVLNSTEVEALGEGIYLAPGQTTAIKVRALINTDNLDIEIWESAPSSVFFTTDGSHKGKLAEDFQSITAVWTTTATKKQGDLKLYAAGSRT